MIRGAYIFPQKETPDTVYAFDPIIITSVSVLIIIANSIIM
jgi:hypothetical protein